MKRSIQVRKPGSSTADLLTWTESDSSNASARSSQPSDGISKVVFGGQVTDGEAQSLLNKDRRPCSGQKMKEMRGSGIFGSDHPSEPTNRPRLRMYQVSISISIFPNINGSVPNKKPTSVPGQAQEAKQRELRGTLPSHSDSNHQRRLSSSKYKEISGHDIFSFAPPPPQEINPTGSKHSMGMTIPRNVPTSVSVSNPPGGHTGIPLSGEPVIKPAKKIHNQKFQDLSGNDIFKEAVAVDPGSAEKKLSRPKLREMRGNDIFSDGKVESRDYLGGIRKPPGGESSISLV
ncbi:hypothetical protein GQ457_05G014570 [Hibiscus cannabinus]